MLPERKMMQKVKKNDEGGGGPLSYAHITGSFTRTKPF